jgi:hypothetical protein
MRPDYMKSRLPKLFRSAALIFLKMLYQPEPVTSL